MSQEATAVSDAADAHPQHGEHEQHPSVPSQLKTEGPQPLGGQEHLPGSAATQQAQEDSVLLSLGQLETNVGVEQLQGDGVQKDMQQECQRDPETAPLVNSVRLIVWSRTWTDPGVVFFETHWVRENKPHC